MSPSRIMNETWPPVPVFGGSATVPRTRYREPFAQLADRALEQVGVGTLVSHPDLLDPRFLGIDHLPCCHHPLRALAPDAKQYRVRCVRYADNDIVDRIHGIPRVGERCCFRAKQALPVNRTGRAEPRRLAIHKDLRRPVQKLACYSLPLPRSGRDGSSSHGTGHRFCLEWLLPLQSCRSP